MGRILDLFGEVAAEADEGEEGLVLSPETWDRLRREWKDEDVEDALGLVHESLLHSELVEAVESLSGRLFEVLGTWGNPAGFTEAEGGRAVLTLDVLGQLARRLDRVEEVLEAFRSGPGPDRTKFDALRNRLLNVGIENEMSSGDDEDERGE
jgi:hypothetical protein